MFVPLARLIELPFAPAEAEVSPDADVDAAGLVASLFPDWLCCCCEAFAEALADACVWACAAAPWPPAEF